MNYKKHYYNLIKNYGTKEKPEDYYSEQHHIKPKCLGGDNQASNIVYLSGKAHFIAHLLLKKMHPSNNKLLLAVLFLSKKHSIHSRTYELLRKEFSELRKSQGKTEGKPVITPKGRFSSIYAAAAHGLSRTRMAKKLRSTSFTCSNYYFEGEFKKTKPRTGHGLHLAKSVSTPVGVFVSCREAATALGVCHSVVARRAKNPNRPDYFYIVHYTAQVEQDRPLESLLN